MKKFTAIVLALLTTSCCWRSPDSSFYMMNSQGLEKISNRSLKVAVFAVDVPSILDRAQMITYANTDNQIYINEFERWGENLPAVLQATVTNDLMAYLPKSFVKSSRYDTDALDYNVKVEINKIEAYPNDKVKLSAWWTISRAGGSVMKRRYGAYEVKVDGDSIADLVKAQNKAVHELSRDIANTLTN